MAKQKYPIVKSKYTYTKSTHSECDGTEKNVKPNQAYKVKELIDLNLRGVKPEIMKKALYDHEIFGEDISEYLNGDTFDKFELVQKINQLEESIKAKLKTQKLEEQQQEVEAMAKKWLDDGGYIPKVTEPTE